MLFRSIEIRVCDTPLTIRRAALLAAYAQALACYYLTERPLEPAAAVYQVNAYNRFEACRYGFAGNLVEPYARRRKAIGEDILDSIAHAMPHALRLGSAQGLSDLAAEVRGGYSDAGWLRAQRGASGTLGDVVRKAAERWASG